MTPEDSDGVAMQVMVATDFSAVSLAAVRKACDFALALGAEVTVVHVLAPGGARKSMAPGRSSRPPPERIFGADNDEGERLKALRETELLRVPKVRLQLVSGESASEAILDQATRMKADLLVLGTHGRTGVAHALVGSVAEVVIRSAPCPVLVVPPSAAERAAHG